MKSINYLGVIGSVLIIAGWFSPMLHIPIIGNWNYWGIDTTLASLVMFLAIVGFLLSLTARASLLKWISWAEFAIILFTLVAVYFKVNDYFSFIPIKKLAALAAHIVQFRWTGWILLFLGSVLTIVAAKRKQEVNI